MVLFDDRHSMELMNQRQTSRMTFFFLLIEDFARENIE